MLHPATRAIVDGYWAQFFGLDRTALPAARTLVVPHAGLGDYPGLWFFRRGSLLIASVPPTLLEHYRAFESRLMASDFAHPDRLGAMLHAPPRRQVGPAWIGYADRATLRPLESSQARLLAEADRPAWEDLREACGAEEWEHGGSGWAPESLAGRFIDGDLVALAGYEVWGGVIAHIALVSHPLQRGRGYGRLAAGRLAQIALERGLVPQYRTLVANAASLQVGRGLGFIGYAKTIALRFDENEP